jgi:hypothetical protein
MQSNNEEEKKELLCSVEDLVGRIAVEYPYNKVQNINIIDAKTLECTFVPEQDHDPEGDQGHGVALVPTSEMGRHMAIAGSLVCALQRPLNDTHHYLAVRGKMYSTKTKSNLCIASNSPNILVRATYKKVENQKYASASALIESNSCVLSIIYFLEPLQSSDAVARSLRLHTAPNPLISLHYARLPLMQYIQSHNLNNMKMVVLRGLTFPGHFSTKKGQCYTANAISTVIYRMIGSIIGAYDCLQVEFNTYRPIPETTTCHVTVKPTSLIPPINAIRRPMTFQEEYHAGIQNKTILLMVGLVTEDNATDVTRPAMEFRVLVRPSLSITAKI